MSRRNVPMLAAVCASLCVHLALLGQSRRLTLGQLGWLDAAPQARHEAQATIVFTDPATNEPEVKPSEPPKPEQPKVKLLPDAMGESTGTGIGSNRSEGTQEQHAREGDADQAFLSLDPVGPGNVGDAPSLSTHLPGEGGTGGLPAAARGPMVPIPDDPPSADEPVPPTPPAPALAPAATVELPPGPPVEIGPREALAMATAPPLVAPHDIGRSITTPATKPALVPKPQPDEEPRAAEHPPTPPAPPRPAVATGDGRLPGADRAAADPAPQSDSESDPFSKIGSAEVRDGRLVPRFGRKVKTTRPQIPIVGQVDAFARGGAAVTLKVNIDPTGKVTTVKVHKSSGSNEIDQPCLVAMYDWWFEPLKDAQGTAIPDVVLFTITFR